MNIAQITPDFNYSCGRSYYVFLLLKYLKQSGNNVFLITNGGDSLDRLQEENIQVIIIKTLNSKDPVSYMRSVVKLTKVFKENKIEIVHTHHRYSEFLALHALKTFRNRKPKTVFTSLSIVHKKYNLEYKSDRIIAVSRVIKEMLVKKFKVDENKIDLIHNFTDSGELKNGGGSKTSDKNEKSYFNILSVGRFHEDKNFKLIFKALKLLNDESIKLTLIGEGESLEDYQKLAEDYNIRTEFVTPQKNLRKFYHEADLCILPSTREPFPGFMLQSGLHKKPFIGAKVDGISELITDGYNGGLFESENKIQLAQKIKFFKDNPVIAQKCGNNLHLDIMNNYTEEFIVPRVEKVYRNVLDS